MALRSAGKLFNNNILQYRNVMGYDVNLWSFDQVRNYALRKGTRARKEAIAKANKAKKAKLLAKMPPYVPPAEKERLRLERLALMSTMREEDEDKPIPCDNVYIIKDFRWKVYSFEEAIRCHREAHDPTIYNAPNSQIHAFIELNMEGVKKTKPVQNFTSLVSIPHGFDIGEKRSVLAFCKNVEDQEKAERAGATAGGISLIKDIQEGKYVIKYFHYYVAHTDILANLVPLRGIMRGNKFPSIKEGTLGMNIEEIVNKFTKGVKYTSKTHPLQTEYGTIDVPIGTLNMETKQLEENFTAIIKDVDAHKPKRPGSFITRARLSSPITQEKFKIDYTLYLSDGKAAEEADEDGYTASDVVIESA